MQNNVLLFIRGEGEAGRLAAIDKWPPYTVTLLYRVHHIIAYTLTHKP